VRHIEFQSNTQLHYACRVYASACTCLQNSLLVHISVCVCFVSYFGRSTEVALEVKAGGVAFFNLNVPHCTKRNATPNRWSSDLKHSDHMPNGCPFFGTSRAAVAYHFVRSDFFRDRAFPLPEEADWKTPVVSGPQSSGGVNEYGLSCDTFEVSYVHLLIFRLM